MKYTKELLDVENGKEIQFDDEGLELVLNEEESDLLDESFDETLMNEKRFLSISKDNSLTHYNASINAFPLLTFDEEIHYSRIVRKALTLDSSDLSSEANELRRKGNLAKQVMIEHNLRLVRSIARKYEGCGVLLEDLIQEGTIGLMEAIDKFDPELGYRFSTYAVYNIRQKIKRTTQDQGSDIKIPLNLQDKITRIKSTQAFLLQHIERNASSLEVAICIALGKEKTIDILNKKMSLTEFSNGIDFGDFNPSDIDDALSVTKSIVSIDMPVSKEDDRDWSDIIAAPGSRSMSSMDFEILKGILRKLMTVLDERQAFVIAYRYGLNGLEKVTYQELGKQIGLTSERTRQIEKEALETLRSCSDSSLLFAFIS